MAKSNNWTQVGTIRVSEKGKLYIKFHGNKDKSGNFSTSNLDLLSSAIKDSGEKGISLQIEKPQDKIRRLASMGYIEESDIEARLDSIPNYIKYEITLPPQEE
jgi:hypothetical protein